MATEPKWHIRAGDRIALLNRLGEQIEEWVTVEVLDADIHANGVGDELTIRVRRGDDVA